MNCPNCGGLIPEGVTSCPSCGAFLNNQMPAQQPMAAPVQDPMMGMQQPMAAPVQDPMMGMQQPMAAPVQDPMMGMQQPMAAPVQDPMMGMQQPMTAPVQDPMMGMQQPMAAPVQDPMMGMQQPMDPMTQMPVDQSYQQPVGGVMPQIKQRNPIVAILLSLLTCGIYGLIWFVGLTNDSNSLVEQNKTASGGMAILLTILTCGLYSFYWTYKLGKKLHEAGTRYGKSIEDRSTIYIILSIVGLGIIAYVMAQSDLNKFASDAPANA